MKYSMKYRIVMVFESFFFLLHKEKKRNKEDFFTENVLNKILDKIRNYTRYFRCMKQHLPQGV